MLLGRVQPRRAFLCDNMGRNLRGRFSQVKALISEEKWAHPEQYEQKSSSNTSFRMTFNHMQFREEEAYEK